MANSVNSTLILNELMVGAAIKGKVNPYVQAGLKLVLIEEGPKQTLNGDDSQHALLIQLMLRIWAVVHHWCYASASVIFISALSIKLKWRAFSIENEEWK